MFSHEDINWTKNIVPKDKLGWAYENVGFDEPFDLQWSTKKRGSVLTAPVGEIILLFQKPDWIGGKRNYDVFLTHLVSPIDNDERHYDRSGFEYGRKVLLIAKPERMDAIRNLRYFSFRNPNRGQTNPIGNLESREGLSTEGIKRKIWELFSNCFNPYLMINGDKVNGENLVYQASEGDTKVIEHYNSEIKQRNSGIVKIAKALAYQKGKGRILCECCDFDFIRTYGTHGDGFIECHHTIPISVGGKRITDIKDLAMVCSNCHRMLHRKKSDGDYYSVEKLRELIANNLAHA